MNITPLIDVVFLLIIFFMLVSNIVAQEAVKMVVPRLIDPETRELGEVTRVVVSVIPNQDFTKSDRLNDPLLFSGRSEGVQIGPFRKYSMDQLAEGTEALKEAVAAAELDADGNSKLEVLLRADAAIYYQDIQPVMAMITAAGIGKVNMVAFMPEE